MTEDFWEKILQTNLLGAFRYAKAAAPALQERRGAIVNMASIAGMGAQGSSLAYAASEAALVNMTRSLARSRPRGPRQRGGTRQHPDPLDGDLARGQKAAGREGCRPQAPGQPEKIAEVVLFLLAGASIITGQTIIADGGTTL